LFFEVHALSYFMKLSVKAGLAKRSGVMRVLGFFRESQFIITGHNHQTEAKGRGENTENAQKDRTPSELRVGVRTRNPGRGYKEKASKKKKQ